MSERQKTEAEILQDQAKNILAGIQEYKNAKEYTALNTAARTMVRELGSLIINEIAPEVIEKTEE